MKRDGMLIGVVLVPKLHPLAAALGAFIASTQDEFARGWWSAGAEDVDSPFLPIVCTQRTLFAASDTQPYIATALLGGHFRITREEMQARRDGTDAGDAAAARAASSSATSTDTAPMPLTPWQLLRPYASRFVRDLRLLLSQPSLSIDWRSDAILSVSFEAICGSRVTAWQGSFNELAVSYEQDLFSVVGLTHSIGRSCGVFVPHAAVAAAGMDLASCLEMSGRFTQPHAWPLRSSADVHRIIRALDAVLLGECTETEVRESLGVPPDVPLDFEGLVVLRDTLPDLGATAASASACVSASSPVPSRFSYSKVKTVAFYKAHKLRSNNLGYLNRLSAVAARALPIVRVVQFVMRSGPQRMAALCAELNLELFDPDRHRAYLAALPARVAAAFASKSRDQQVQLLSKASPGVFRAATRKLFEAAFACRLDPAETKLAVQIDTIITAILSEIQPHRFVGQGEAQQLQLQQVCQAALTEESPMTLQIIKIVERCGTA